MLIRARIIRAAVVLAAVATALPALPQPAQAATYGSWKVDCTYLNSAMDDPIVAPGRPGASHVHDFFGNRGVNAYSTLASMTGVASSCAHGDRSAYWVPALYRDGVKVQPSSFIAYYENRLPNATIEAFPPGFQLVFGNKDAVTLAQSDTAHINWGCGDNTQIGTTIPTSCAGGTIQLRLLWPMCWDGKTDNGNATKHVSFAPGGNCPTAYPHAMPTIRTNIVYKVGTSTGNITLASGFVTSVHGDFFNAWDQDVLEGLVRDCLNAHVDCGHFKGTTSGSAPVTPTTTPATSTTRTTTTTTTPPAVPTTTTTVAPAPSTTTAPAPVATVSTRPACTATAANRSAWAGGFLTEVTVKTTSAVSRWSVAWTASSGVTIRRLWNGSLTVNGSAVTVGSAAYNSALAAGGTATFGFYATGSPAAPKLTCTAA